MISKSFFLAGLALIGLPLGAGAQDPPKPPAFGLPMMSFGGGSNLLQPLRRDEVQSHLHLTAKQKLELEDLLKNSPRTRVSVTANSQDANDPESIKRQIEDQLAKQRTSLDDRIKAVLKPEQYSRLRELALQWRGLLSLGDSTVAEALKISPQHRSDINHIMGDYNMRKGEIMMAAAQTNENADGSGRVARTIRLDASKLLQPGSEAFKKLTSIKAEAESKINGVLSADEKAAWKTAQGEPFTFRTDVPGMRF